jgi:hypothetical protein
MNVKLMTGYVNVIYGTSVVVVVNVIKTNFAIFLSMLILHK